MPVKIRLMRIGARKRPFYRVVAVDERRKRTGGYLELLGTYNPMSEPHEIILKQDLIDAWIKKGAQPSNGFLRIIGKAPQRPPRQPKKKKEVTETLAPAEAPKEEKLEVSEVKPAEETDGSEKQETADDSAKETQSTKEGKSESSI